MVFAKLLSFSLGVGIIMYILKRYSIDSRYFSKDFKLPPISERPKLYLTNPQWYYKYNKNTKEHNFGNSTLVLKPKNDDE